MRIVFGLLTLLFFSGCTGASVTNENAGQKYFFDLKSYFQKEAERLQNTNKPVMKTVSRNNLTEKKRMLLDWPSELELFIESDINKAGWKDSYRTVKSGDTTEYVASDENLKTQRIALVKNTDGKIRHIGIINRVSNFLYSSTEKLDYFPDSLYSITKEQSVRIIGQNHYTISAMLK